MTKLLKIYCQVFIERSTVLFCGRYKVKLAFSLRTSEMSLSVQKSA